MEKRIEIVAELLRSPSNYGWGFYFARIPLWEGLFSRKEVRRCGKWVRGSVFDLCVHIFTDRALRLSGYLGVPNEIFIYRLNLEIYDLIRKLGGGLPFQVVPDEMIVKVVKYDGAYIHPFSEENIAFRRIKEFIVS